MVNRSHGILKKQEILSSLGKQQWKDPKIKKIKEDGAMTQKGSGFPSNTTVSKAFVRKEAHTEKIGRKILW